MTNEQRSLIVLLCGEMYESSRNIGRLLGSKDTPHALSNLANDNWAAHYEDAYAALMAAIFEIGCSNEA